MLQETNEFVCHTAADGGPEGNLTGAPTWLLSIASL